VGGDVIIGKASAEPLTGPALMEIARSSVFRIEGALGPHYGGHGTAFVYKQTITSAGSTYYLLTNLHNFSGLLPKAYEAASVLARDGASEDEFRLRFAVVEGSTELPVSEIICVRDALFSHARPYMHDFAVCIVKSPRTEPLTMFALPSLEVAREGEQVFALGYPLDTDLGITEGIIGHLYQDEVRDSSHTWMIQHSILINPGNSGGPTVTAHGNAVGISTWGYGYAPGLNFSVNTAKTVQLLADLELIETIDIGALSMRIIRRAVEEARYGR